MEEEGVRWDLGHESARKCECVCVRYMCAGVHPCMYHVFYMFQPTLTQLTADTIQLGTIKQTEAMDTTFVPICKVHCIQKRRDVEPPGVYNPH